MSDHNLAKDTLKHRDGRVGLAHYFKTSVDGLRRIQRRGKILPSSRDTK